MHEIAPAMLRTNDTLEAVLKPSVGSPSPLFSSVDFAHNRLSGWVLVVVLNLALACLPTIRAAADQAPHPQMGYVFPPGATAGGTYDVQLGGYNWTPDMQFFVLDERVRLEVVGPLGKMLMPEPPFFVGNKAYYPSPIPRERSARFVIPQDMPAGPVRWQVANANGASATGVFWIGRGPEVIEQERRATPQKLHSLPVTVSGRLFKNEEVDRYLVRTDVAGPVTCVLFARRLGSKFHGLLEVRDADGNLVMDAADTKGLDTSLAFRAEAGRDYVLSLNDVDFRGNRSFVYRLMISRSPHVLAAIPSAGRRGETRPVEFIGVGVATGSSKIESATQIVSFPDDPEQQFFDYALQTEFGPATTHHFLLSDLTESTEPTPQPSEVPLLDGPMGITGRLDARKSVDRYRFAAAKDELWWIGAQACPFDSPLDMTIRVLDPDGKQLAENDDLPGTSDAGLPFVAPADATYEIVVGDVSGASGSARAVYRLELNRPAPDFQLEVPQRMNVLIAGEAELVVKAKRTGGHNAPISISFDGLPDGVTVADDLTIPGGASELKIAVQATDKAPSSASLVTVTGTAVIGDQTATRTAQALANGNLAARSSSDRSVSRMLVASVMKPRVKIWPVESDERTVHRGTTHLAEIGIERQEHFEGDVLVQMESQQPHKYRRGILGPDVLVRPGADRTLYPCLVPESCETVDAYRFLLVAVAKVPDPLGNVRHLLSRMPAPDNSIAITVEGALLKINCPANELKPGTEPIRVAQSTTEQSRQLEIPVRISRSAKLGIPIRLDLLPSEGAVVLLEAEAIEVSPTQKSAVFHVTIPNDDRLVGRQTMTVRATGVLEGAVPALADVQDCSPLDAEALSSLRSGLLPVVSETSVIVDFQKDKLLAEP